MSAVPEPPPVALAPAPERPARLRLAAAPVTFDPSARPASPAAAAPVTFVQRMVASCSWALFVLGWVRVADQVNPERALLLDGTLIVGTTVLVLSVTAWWIRHNRAIYVRKGPRRAVKRPQMTLPVRDHLLRPLRGHLGALRDSPEVVVSVEAGDKWYRGAA